jgi:cytidylate kinase
MEGRDIGTAVFPETPHKFYLDASPEVRRRRRAAEGHTDSIEKRDRIDSTRRHAPLSVAPDANVIDTSHLTLEGVVEAISGILRQRGIGPA